MTWQPEKQPYQTPNPYSQFVQNVSTAPFLMKGAVLFYTSREEDRMQLSYRWLPAKESSFQRGRNGAKVKSFVWHTTEGTRAGDIPTLTGHDPEHNVSVHWYVQRDGAIYHFVADDDTAFHAGKVDKPIHDNRHTVGVEHEHIKGQNWPKKQVDASALVYAFLLQQYPGAEIVRHSQIATFTMYGSDYGRRDDPTDFPSKRFWAAVSALGNETIEATRIE